jgi:hypothetical protein
LAAAVWAQPSQPEWRLPATIEALKDVTVVLRTDGRRLRGELDVATPPPGFVHERPEPREYVLGPIRKGERFEVTEILEEGGCVIKIARRVFNVGSCHWLEGFRDHEDDFFKVVSGRVRAPR